MKELINIIDSRICKNSNDKMSLKSTPCKVVRVFDNNDVKVKLVSSGAEYTVSNYSGSQVQVGETVQLFYKEMINQNNAYIGASAYKKDENNNDIIVIDNPVKNVIMNAQTGYLGDEEFSLANVYVFAKQSTDVTIFLNANILGYDDNNIVFSIFVDDVEQAYKPVVSVTNQLYTAISFSIPVSLDNRIHSIRISRSGTGVVENICAYVTGHYIEKVEVYGYHVNPNESDSFEAVSYIGDAVGKKPAKMGETTFDYGSWGNAFFMPRPCMLRYDGTVAYYLDPNDYTKKIDGTPSDVGDPDFEGNAMMEWGKIWYKFAGGNSYGEGYFYVSDRQIDETYHCWCNYDSKDNIIPYFYTAIYNSTTHINRFRSLSGFALTEENGVGKKMYSSEIQNCVANNKFNNEIQWYGEVYADRILINALLVLMGKSLNTQATFGRGLDTGNGATKNAYITGTLDDKGLFYGDTTTGDSAVKVFGMENWWGCVQRRVAGCATVGRSYKIKLTYGTADGSTATAYDYTGNGYITIGTIPANSGYISKMRYDKYGYMPYEVSDSRDYYADYYTYLNGTSTTIKNVAFGGYCGKGVGAGAFSISDSVKTSSELWYNSTNLSCKPFKR